VRCTWRAQAYRPLKACLLVFPKGRHTIGSVLERGSSHAERNESRNHLESMNTIELVVGSGGSIGRIGVYTCHCWFSLLASHRLLELNLFDKEKLIFDT